MTMKKCIGLIVLLLVSCGTNETEETSEQMINDSNDTVSSVQNDESLDEVEVEAEEEGQETASSVPALKIPTDKTKRDESQVMSYVREGIEPNNIEIPALGIDAPIEDVGLLDSGQMDEPSTMDGVAWYEGGYLPGEQGSSVLAGHVDSKTGPAVFYQLEELTQGDEIIVTDEQGEEKIFVVQESKSYDRNEAPLQKIFGYSYRSQLNLITCTGEFNSKAGTHDERLVVYTVLKDDLSDS